MKHFLRFLWLRTRDLVEAGGLPPYVIVDHQSYEVKRAYWSLVNALAVADSTAVTAKGGTMFEVCIGFKKYRFTRDRFGRLHLPKALRERIL
jgi:hypothetical protein